MSMIKKAFSVLLIFDFIGMILGWIALFPTFKTLSEYGQLMMGVSIAIVAVAVAVQLFEILAKIFLIRSTSPEFSWSDSRKGYVVAAKFLWLFNLASAIIGVLSIGGEGATLINQINTYIRLLASVAEMIVDEFLNAEFEGGRHQNRIDMITKIENGEFNV